MKLINKITLGMLALAGLASCEMREEIWGKAPVTETGVMTVAVDAQAPVATKAPISTANFLLNIFNKEGEIEHSFSKVSDFPAVGVTLPVGDYRVAAYSQDPTTVEKRMDKPYYKGNEIATIVAGVTKTNVVVDCKMQNTRIVVEPDATFGAMFSEWTMTLDDGSETALVFRHTDSNWDAYWLFPEGVETLIGNITGKTVTGNSIAQTFSVSKSSATEKEEGDDSDYFEGGEKLVISLKHTTATEGNVNGITVNATITFTNTDTEVDIPVHWEKDEPSTEPDKPTNPDTPDTPGTGDGTEPTLSCAAFETGIVYSYSEKDYPEETNVVISCPNGIKSLKVIIDGGNPGFTAAVKDLNFTGDGRELVGDKTLQEGLGISMPNLGQTEDYTFPIAGFYSMMNIYGPTVDVDAVKDGKPIGIGNGVDGKEYHSFKMLVTDNNGLTANAELQIKVTK